MRVLVTGGAGYLGTAVVRALIDARRPVTVLDRFDHGTQPLLSAVARSHSLVSVVRGDVCDPGAVADALTSADAVIHLAGIVGYPACDADPREADRTNVEGTRLLCSRLEGRPLLFASTGSTYGKVDGLALESQPISPLTRYGRNKAEAEGFVRDAGGVSFRLATLYGTSCRMRWDLLPHTFTREAATTGVLHLYEGRARRTFLHVKDAAAAFVEALGTKRQYGGGLFPGEVYNVGRPQGNGTKAGVAAVVAGVTNCQVVEVGGEDPDQRDYNVGFGKIREALPRWALPLMREEYQLEAAVKEVAGWARCWK